MHAGERANERRLAGAIGADDGDDGALLDVERDTVERLGVAVEHVEVFDGEHHTALRAEIGLHDRRIAHDLLPARLPRSPCRDRAPGRARRAPSPRA